MRPEFTRAVGAGFVGYMNRVARTRGATGVKAALAPTLGGNPAMPTQRFAGGGIFGWIGKTVSGVGSKAWETIKKGASWLKDGVEHNLKTLIEQRGFTTTQVQQISDTLRRVYEAHQSAERYQTTVAGKKVAADPARTLKSRGVLRTSSPTWPMSPPDSFMPTMFGWDASRAAVCGCSVTPVTAVKL